MDCECVGEEKKVNRQISTDSRTKGTCVLIGIRFLVFLLLDFGTKVEKEKSIHRMNYNIFLNKQLLEVVVLSDSTKAAS